MGGVRQTPRIGIEFDFDTEEYVLNATSYSTTAPAGERLFRASPPNVKFRHPDRASAEKDQATLQQYLDDYAAGKLKDKAGDGEEAAITRGPRGWWED